MNKTLRVIDFFCGAGGFSEGFRQQGFKIIMGIDNWRPAVQTHNLNHGLNDEVMDVLDFEKGIEKINSLPNTEVIIGSPPCVTFSMSNKAGKADKSLGIRLIEAYLRVVAVKKHQPSTILKAWLMENVPNSRNFVKEYYTFEDLNLADWAISIGKEPEGIALKVKSNGGLYTASDYGSPQSRQRFICGEVVRTSRFPEPKKTHGARSLFQELKPFLTLGDIKGQMPSPQEKDEDTSWVDPNYPNLILKKADLTDHFYDTGVYEVEWSKARDAKINHPFMGRMSFPEDEGRPSRTIMATRSASTREAIIFKSDYDRRGDGEYRLPTIREAATLMGFPYTYQFIGSEGTKWRLIGNAVCPHMASALAKATLISDDRKPIPPNKIKFNLPEPVLEPVTDLNNSQPRDFGKPPRKSKGAKFRMHPFKTGNMTVALTNYDPFIGSDPTKNGVTWYCSIFLGSGKDYLIVPVTNEVQTQVRDIIEHTPGGPAFIQAFAQRFNGRIPNGKDLQRILESNEPTNGPSLGPTLLIRDTAELIEEHDKEQIVLMKIRLDGIQKSQFPLRQILAIEAISRMIDTINQI